MQDVSAAVAAIGLKVSDPNLAEEEDCATRKKGLSHCNKVILHLRFVCARMRPPMKMMVRLEPFRTAWGCKSCQPNARPPFQFEAPFLSVFGPKIVKQRAPDLDFPWDYALAYNHKSVRAEPVHICQDERSLIPLGSIKPPSKDEETPAQRNLSAAFEEVKEDLFGEQAKIRALERAKLKEKCKGRGRGRGRGRGKQHQQEAPTAAQPEQPCEAMPEIAKKKKQRPSKAQAAAEAVQAHQGNEAEAAQPSQGNGAVTKKAKRARLEASPAEPPARAVKKPRAARAKAKAEATNSHNDALLATPPPKPSVSAGVDTPTPVTHPDAKAWVQHSISLCVQRVSI